MIFAAGTFVTALVVVFGAYWLFVARPEAAERSSAVSRLRRFNVDTPSGGLVLAPTRLSAIPFLDRLLNRRRDVAGPLERLLMESGLTVNVGTFVLMLAVAAAAGAVLAWLVIGHVLRVRARRGRQRLTAVPLRASQAHGTPAGVRGTVPRGDRPDLPRAPGRPCPHHHQKRTTC